MYREWNCATWNRRSYLLWTSSTVPTAGDRRVVIVHRYWAFRDENGEYLPEYFHLLAIRLGFVIIFEVSVSQTSLNPERSVNCWSAVRTLKTCPIFLPQHVVFFIGRLIDLMVPDVSEEVEMKIKREHYMAKEALAENQVSKLTECHMTVCLAVCLLSCSMPAVSGEDHDSWEWGSPAQWTATA